MIMGRIKTQLVKRTTNELLEQYGDKFSEDYEKNKRVVAQLVIGVGKKIRNIIAGYVTRLVKKQHASE
ncbi:MAG: small subunit ribosomal protein S17e [archaeon GW2011_AR16]|nr:MAG: small subunit ribosomal protein S17e [archaeon GW2011_AR16]